ncbi:hypothetical protein ACFL6E_07565 [Candidatus Neomarinimicrobiota bacterium]
MMQSGGAQGLNLGSLLSAKRMIKGAASSLPGSLVALFDFSKTDQSHGPGQFSSLVRMLRGKPSNSGQTVFPLQGKIGQPAKTIGNLVAKSVVAAGRQKELAKSQFLPDSNAETLLPDASTVAPTKATGMTAVDSKGQPTTVTSKHHADLSATTSKKTVAGQVVPTVEIAVNGTEAPPVKASSNAVVEQTTSVPGAALDSSKGTPIPAQGISKILNVTGRQVGNNVAPAIQVTRGNAPEEKATVTGPDGIQLKIVEPGKQATPGKIVLPLDVKASREQIKVIAAGKNVTVAKEVGTITENLEPHQKTTNQGNQSQPVEPVISQSKGESQAVIFGSKGIRLANTQPAINVANEQPAINVANAQPVINVANKQPVIIVNSEGKLVQTKASPLDGDAADHKVPTGQNATNQMKNQSVSEKAAPKVQITPFGQGKIAAKMAKMMAGEPTHPASSTGKQESTPQKVVDQASKIGGTSGKQAPRMVVPSDNKSEGQKVISQPTGRVAVSNVVPKNARISLANADNATASRANHSLEPAAPAATGGMTKPEPTPAIRIMPELGGQAPQVALKTPESHNATLIKGLNAPIPTRGSVTKLASEGVKSTGMVKSDHIQSDQIGQPQRLVDQVKVLEVPNSVAQQANGANGVVNAAISGVVTGVRVANSQLAEPKLGQDTAKKPVRKKTSSINQTNAVKAKVNVDSRNKAVYSASESNDKTAKYSTIALNGSSKQTAGDSVTSNNGQVTRVADMVSESTVIADSFSRV